MKKYLSTLAALTMGMALVLPSIAQAATNEKTAIPKTSAKTTPSVKKSPSKKPVVSKEDEDDPEPDVSGSIAIDYACELGNKLTIHANRADQDHIALRWNKRLIRLERVGTTTGANRFESRKRGLIWIGIPAKGILLDSRKGQQLANECKSADQLALKTASASVVPALIAPAVQNTENSSAPVSDSGAAKK